MNRFTRTVFCLCALSWVGATSVTLAGDPRTSIVKIYTTYQTANWARPWLKEGSSGRSGSGCIVEGNRILTNAHVVSDQTFVEVRRAGSPDKFVAEVEWVSHELDLALVKVADVSFFDGAIPLKLGKLPPIGTEVVATGFPTGGRRVTVTRGVISRMERQSYGHSGMSNLVCQIDAAINPGASGGPVLDASGSIVGVVFQSRSGQNIGYMVPEPVVRHFFKDIQDGRLDGSPILSVRWQMLENEGLRKSLGLTAKQSGVLVIYVAPLDPPLSTPIRVGDVIRKIAGLDVGNDGTIALSQGQRVGLSYACDRMQVGQSVSVVVYRAGKDVAMDVKLVVAKKLLPRVVPLRGYELRPKYFVVGGLVFSPLTANYFSVWEKWTSVPQRLSRYWHEDVTEKNRWREEVVACIRVLPDGLNRGYKSMEDRVVSTVNGKRIGTMRELVDAFESNTEEFHRIRFDGGVRVVLDRAVTEKLSPKILERYDVTTDRSADLR